jgi:hypothetical protein
MLEKVLKWVITFLRQDSNRQFKPMDWHMRTDASDKQNPESNDCAQYVITMLCTSLLGMVSIIMEGLSKWISNPDGDETETNYDRYNDRRV